MTTPNLVMSKDMTFDQFVRAMDSVGYLPVDLHALMSLYNTVKESFYAKQGDPFPTIILDGPPGVGKSYMAKCLKALLKAEYLQYNCHPDSSAEEVIRDINTLVHVLSQSGLANKQYTMEDMFIYGQLYDAIRQSNVGPAVLLFDELDKVRSSFEALLLGFLNDGYISVPGLGEDFGVKRLFGKPENLIVVITKNDERDLGLPMLRRGNVIHMAYPKHSVETQMLMDLAGIGEEAAKSMATQANSLRQNKGISKPPSSPELVRLARNFLRIAQNDVVEGVGPDGKKRLECRVPKSILNQSFINGFLPIKHEQPIGRKVLNNKGSGTALLHRILVGMGVPDQKIIHKSERDVISGK